MRHDTFIGQVQDRAKLPSRGAAEAATRAVVETLGERLPERLADHMASQLPREIGEHLRRTEVFSGAGTGERFGRAEFIHRVGERANMAQPQTRYASRVVMEVLREATQGGQMDKVRDALPEQLRELVDSGSSGEMHTT
ncbi:DUF2267 domain-containing protein [Actinopolyspora erythraea]|uniref:DUF2267 domain-containing protein n=1 Tax=Actinopolyspora erythraea TaxID=414996 RepID=A0A099D4S0_9ACTN|nr:DUF2267 domain-containing protein [Actinopolyspora erythraea]ASU79044.1 DUF2267 domain-containing protein [Actinopolyspora erythraea]KGI81173.1 hypothetical protein IL38_13065 [Actinopolyspora erythraea]